MQGNFPAAMMDFSEAIKINPSNGDAYYLRGLSWFMAACQDLLLARNQVTNYLLKLLKNFVANEFKKKLFFVINTILF